MPPKKKPQIKKQDLIETAKFLLDIVPIEEIPENRQDIVRQYREDVSSKLSIDDAINAYMALHGDFLLAYSANNKAIQSAMNNLQDDYN